MTEHGAEPTPLDTERPNAARIYDYFLGGAHNFAVDREAAQAAQAAFPGLPATMRAGRAFLRRAVRFLLDGGITQFLDLGSGIPTVGNVDEIVRRAGPGARVVYVDIDPVAVTHAGRLLADSPDAVILHADIRRPDTVLDHPDTRRLLDFTRPVGLLFNGVLHFVPDADDPEWVIGRYLNAVVPGSYLAIGHATGHRPDPDETAAVGKAQAVYRDAGDPVTPRGRDEIAALFAGTDLVDPGLVEVDRWRPDTTDSAPTGLAGYAGVGRIQ